MATLTNQEIARELGISMQTVKNLWYLEVYPTMRRLAKAVSIYWSSNGTQRTQALLVALRIGLIELEEVSGFTYRQGEIF